MKKLSFASMAILLVLLFTLTLIGCPQTSGGQSENPENTTNNSSGTNNGSGTGGGGTTNTPATTATLTAAQVTAFQNSINAATAGTTVTLTAGTVPTGSSITIDKALTVNGNSVDGLTVRVSSEVSSNVVLRNFRNATVQVYSSSQSSSSVRRSRAAEATGTTGTTGTTETTGTTGTTGNTESSEGSDNFKRFGDESLPLYLENCTVEKLDTEVDIALYLGNGDEKTTIEELNLKEGVEDFTFIEFDDEETTLTEKSQVGKLSIEDGVEKINLIGGTFNDVELADDFANEIDFKYDKEFDNQLNFEDKNAFLAGEYVEAKDIAVADKTVTATDTGVYKFTMTNANFNSLNGYLTIVFFTDAQKEAILNPPQTGVNQYATYENPVYAAIPAGEFTVNLNSTATYRTIYGSEPAYADYAHAAANGHPNYYLVDDIVVLDYFRNYNKDAFITEFTENGVNIYVNMAAIKKNDLVLCACVGDDNSSYGESGTKLAEINLNGYKPYLAIDWQYYTFTVWDPAHPIPVSTDYENEDDFWSAITARQNELIEFKMSFNPLSSPDSNDVQMPLELFIPYGNALKMGHEAQFSFSAMTSVSAYPAGAATTEYEQVSTEGHSNYFSQWVAGVQSGEYEE